MINEKNHLCIIPTPISKTALDSLHSKLSAIDAGWLDGGHNPGDESESFGSRTPSIQHPIEFYARLLREINAGLSDSPVKTSNNEENNDVKLLKTKRQTPLVNAGYAARMAVMTFMLERWLDLVVSNIISRTSTGDSSSSESNASGDDKSCNAIVNVVVLGSGMDALGIWSKHVLQRALQLRGFNSRDKDAPKIKVYEFDAWDNCVLKRKALISSSILRDTFYEDGSTKKRDSVTLNSDHGGEAENFTGQKFSVICQGEIIFDNNRDQVMEGRGEAEPLCNLRNQNRVDYNLVALDLRVFSEEPPGQTPKSVLSLASKAVEMDTSQPTIILSELVLAYLSRDGANAVLRSIASDLLGTHEYSTLACLEPIFHVGIDEQYRPLSVEQSYAIRYGKQFSSKIQRGNSKEKNPWFHPLASDRYSLHRRLHNDCGFPTSRVISYVPLGEAVIHVSSLLRGCEVNEGNNSVVAKVGSQFLLSKEPFDEHAALALNLKCYGMVCVVPSIGSGMEYKAEIPSWIQVVCPWTKGFRSVDGILTTSQLNAAVQIKPITTSSEDEQVRILFGETYNHLYSSYPAIRKCAKSALKGDLSPGVTEFDDIERNERSSIRARYVQDGGEFWVAVVPTDGAEAKVVGCVGIRQRKMKNNRIDIGSTKDSVKSSEYELFRLVVDNTHRGRGIGKSLIHLAQDFAVFRSIGNLRSNSGHSENSVKIWAVTAQFFIAANQLYEAAEFVCCEKDGLLNSRCKMIVFDK